MTIGSLLPLHLQKRIIRMRRLRAKSCKPQKTCSQSLLASRHQLKLDSLHLHLNLPKPHPTPTNSLLPILSHLPPSWNHRPSGHPRNYTAMLVVAEGMVHLIHQQQPRPPQPPARTTFPVFVRQLSMPRLGPRRSQSNPFRKKHRRRPRGQRRRPRGGHKKAPGLRRQLRQKS